MEHGQLAERFSRERGGGQEIGTRGSGSVDCRAGRTVRGVAGIEERRMVSGRAGYVWTESEPRIVACAIGAGALCGVPHAVVFIFEGVRARRAEHDEFVGRNRRLDAATE